MEDTVATLGGLLAVIAVTISHFTPFHQAEGIASVLIGDYDVFCGWKGILR